MNKRVILSMGGKGGVGKTSVMTGLAEWFRENQNPVKLLDLDTENKARGSLAHFFGDDAPKVNIHTPAGLDSFVDELTVSIWEGSSPRLQATASARSAGQ
jgi:MinD-like ATPase involved in chromosome partitioning or flagellar assembly